MLLLLSPMLATCMKPLTLPHMVIFDGRVLQPTTIFTRTAPALKLLLHERQQHMMVGFVIHANSFATCLPTVALIRNLTIYLIKSMTTTVSTGSITSFLAIGASAKQ